MSQSEQSQHLCIAGYVKLGNVVFNQRPKGSKRVQKRPKCSKGAEIVKLLIKRGTKGPAQATMDKQGPKEAKSFQNVKKEN